MYNSEFSWLRHVYNPHKLPGNDQKSSPQWGFNPTSVVHHCVESSKTAIKTIHVSWTAGLSSRVPLENQILKPIICFRLKNKEYHFIVKEIA